MDVLVRDGKRQVLTGVARVVTNTAGNKEVQEKITNLERQMEQLLNIVKANDEETGSRMGMLERNCAPIGDTNRQQQEKLYNLNRKADMTMAKAKRAATEVGSGQSVG
jgi:hypothetical protein